MPGIGTALGFYQDRQQGSEAVTRLRRSGRRNCAAIHCPDGGRITVIGRRLARFPAAALVALTGIASWRGGAAWAEILWSGSAVTEALAPVIGAAAAWGAAWLLNGGIPGAVITRHMRLNTPNETLVIAQAPSADIGHVLGSLRDVQGEAPITFAFPGRAGALSPRPTNRAEHRTICGPPMSPTGLRAAAECLACGIRQLGRGVPQARRLSARLQASKAALAGAQRSLADTARLGKPLSTAAEWLLDNAYILEGHIAEFTRCLPRGFYRSLPIIGGGPLVGLPRTYAIASELVADTDGRLDADTIHAFVEAYQADTPLTIGELWALPLMVRLALIEFVQRHAELVEFREHEREQADFWANRALSTARRDPARLAALLTELGHAHPKPSAHLGEQLLDYLRDEDSAWGPVRGWLETVYDLPLAAVFQQQNVQQASEQVALANAIGSLRLLTHLRWQESFERLSAVEDVLRTDPAGVYPHMDFATRDRYRRVVEAIARAARVPETTVAAQAIALASGDDGTDGTNGTDGAGKEARGEGSHCHPSPERPATGRGRGEKRAGGDWDRHVG